MDVVERARRDVTGGRLWKARDRLTGALRSRPSDQRILELLGEVCYRMGDHPEAGRYWFLTERGGPDMERALRALHARYGTGSRALAEALPVRSDPGDFPESVAVRLRTIAAKHADLTAGWQTRVRRHRPVEPSESHRSRLRTFAVTTAVLAATVGVWTLGAMELVRLLFGLEGR